MPSNGYEYKDPLLRFLGAEKLDRGINALNAYTRKGISVNAYASGVDPNPLAKYPRLPVQGEVYGPQNMMDRPLPLHDQPPAPMNQPSRELYDAVSSGPAPMADQPSRELYDAVNTLPNRASIPTMDITLPDGRKMYGGPGYAQKSERPLNVVRAAGMPSGNKFIAPTTPNYHDQAAADKYNAQLDAMRKANEIERRGGVAKANKDASLKGLTKAERMNVLLKREEIAGQAAETEAQRKHQEKVYGLQKEIADIQAGTEKGKQAVTMAQIDAAKSDAERELLLKKSDVELAGIKKRLAEIQNEGAEKLNQAEYSKALADLSNNAMVQSYKLQMAPFEAVKEYGKAGQEYLNGLINDARNPEGKIYGKIANDRLTLTQAVPTGYDAIKEVASNWGVDFIDRQTWSRLGPKERQVQLELMFNKKAASYISDQMNADQELLRKRAEQEGVFRSSGWMPKLGDIVAR